MASVKGWPWSPFSMANPPEEICFNRAVLLDLMTLDGCAVLHVMYKATVLSEATFRTAGQSTDAV